MQQPTYTTAQIHRRLDVPKPTIRNWSAEYAAYLSERAQPADGRTRRFTYADLIVLNTVRRLSRVEGLNSNDLIRERLAEGYRDDDLPDVPTEEEANALKDVQLVPGDRLARALDRIDVLEEEAEQAISEREQALSALGDAQQQIAVMREQTGQLRGLLMGVSMGGVGLLLIALASTAGLLTVIVELKP
jgi:DNA-binding transcriptional MerR regulator